MILINILKDSQEKERKRIRRNTNEWRTRVWANEEQEYEGMKNKNMKEWRTRIRRNEEQEQE